MHSSGCEHRIITCSHSVQNLQFEKASQWEEDVRQEEGTRNSLFRQLMDMYFLDNINLPLKLPLICYMLHTSISPLLPFPICYSHSFSSTFLWTSLTLLRLAVLCWIWGSADLKREGENNSRSLDSPKGKKMKEKEGREVWGDGVHTTSDWVERKGNIQAFTV